MLFHATSLEREPPAFKCALGSSPDPVVIFTTAWDPVALPRRTGPLIAGPTGNRVSTVGSLPVASANVSRLQSCTHQTCCGESQSAASVLRRASDTSQR